MKQQLHTVNLSTTEAIVLQQIHDDVEDDVATLSQQLGMPRGRTAALIEALKQKGNIIKDNPLTDEISCQSLGC